MASGKWASSDRRTTLSPEFFRNRGHVLKRDGRRCQIAGPTCIGVATDVDHIGDRNNDDPSNLRAACKPCHGLRSAQQGGQASATSRRARVASRTRAPERHPGILD